MSQHERVLMGITAASGIALCFALNYSTHSGGQFERLAHRPLGASMIFSSGDPSVSYSTEDPSVRVALRLQRRLRTQAISAPFDVALDAVRWRMMYLKSSVHVTAVNSAGSTITEWQDSPQSHPLWINMFNDDGSLHTDINESEINASLSEHPVLRSLAPIDSHITSLSLGAKVERATADRPARSGYVLDNARAASDIAAALRRQQGTVSVTLEQKAGAIINNTGIPIGALSLLGTGESNFRGSPDGRVKNVRKALREHVSNTLVAPGARYSFNAGLGGSVSLRKGWYQAKVINAGVLKVEPGGGICQASTTVFRGLLRAGLTVDDWKNHSMYVSYYEQGGVGLDATVYMGEQDLSFVNDTPGYILIQAYDDGDNAVVNVYGTPDGRTTVLEGPFFSGNAPAEFSGDQNLRKNEIGWIQNVEYPDGHREGRILVSTYRALPKSIVYKYTAITMR